jgi:hypothetical protein
MLSAYLQARQRYQGVTLKGSIIKRSSFSIIIEKIRIPYLYQTSPTLITEGLRFITAATSSILSLEQLNVKAEIFSSSRSLLQ